MTFQVSGSLWRDALVMQDMETKSLWSQISGECIQGDMEGYKLTLIPVLHTTYEQFIKLYPNGLLLKKESKGEHGSRYKSYFDDPKKLGMFGRADNFQKLPGKDRVVGLRLGEFDVAVSLAYLKKHGYALLENTSPPVIVTYDTSGQTVSAFTLPQYGEGEARKLSVSSGSIKLDNPDVTWHAGTGRLVEGSAENLAAVPVISAYWFAWASFFPETQLIK